MIGKILKIVVKVADIILVFLPLLGAWRQAKKATAVTKAIMIAVQKFGENEGKAKWEVLKDTITEVTKKLGVQDKVKALKKKLKKKKMNFLRRIFRRG